MAIYVAFLRAVNVSGTGKLAMTDLKRICEQCGFTDVKTHIASGNVVFRAKLTAPKVKAKLETALLKPMGKPCLVFVRTADELEDIVNANPYPDAHPSRMIVVFLDSTPAKDAIKDWTIPGDEQMTIVGRELFIHFPTGQGTSKLKVPFAAVGTGRNLNTTRAMLALARERE